MTRPVRIALQLQPEHADYQRIRGVVAEAEAAGVDIIFTWDHFFPLTGDPNGKHFECWTMLAAWAEMTSRVEVGPLVTCNSYRNPDLLADMARTVDHISGGRLILGIGSGWFERDHQEYGYEFETAGRRIDELAAALPRIDARLSKLNPPPVRDIPILVGGSGELRTLPLVARHASIWHCFGDPSTIRRKRHALDQHCDNIGRDSAGIELAVSVAGGPSPEGGPERLGRALRGIGASLFCVGINGPGYDLGLLRRWIAWRDAKATAP